MELTEHTSVKRRKHTCYVIWLLTPKELYLILVNFTITEVVLNIQLETSMAKYKIYTDGSSARSDNDSPWISGIGYVILDSENNLVSEGSCGGYDKIGAAELRAAIMGIEAAMNVAQDVDNSTFVVYSDSKYVVNAINRDMYLWKNEVRYKERVNYNLIENLLRLSREATIKSNWVSSRASNDYNNFAHDIANESRREFLLCEA
jgi:ribonuclease HI